MARIPALFLRLSVIACAALMLLLCVHAVHAQDAGGFQAAPGGAPAGMPAPQQTPAMPQPGAASAPATLYDAQNGPTAPMYGGAAPSGAYGAPPAPALYSAQSAPDGPAPGYYSMQITPMQNASPYGAQAYGSQPVAPYMPAQSFAPAPYAQPAPQVAPQPMPVAAPQPVPPQAPPPQSPVSMSPASMPMQAGAMPYTDGSTYGIPQRLQASSGMPGAATPGAGGYTLGPGDKVRVTVYDETDMTGEYQVDGNGAVRLPLIGTLRAGGSTAAGLEQTIHDALSPNYIKNPRINVEITSYRPIYVVGAVGKPGQYAYLNDMTMLNAVALAGGFTDQAVQSTVYVRHEGETQEQPVSTAMPLLIRPGDTIQVKTTLFWDAMNMFSPLAGPLAVTAAAAH